MSLLMVSKKASTLGDTRNPLYPLMIMLVSPPTLDATTHFPMAIASIAESDVPSDANDGITTISTP
ncbi:hypothetical protein D3C86_2209420 [compost metagenome]